MPASFEGSGTEIPFVILDDEAYPLTTYLLKPFARKDLHLKNVLSLTGCRKRGDALGVPLVS